VGFQFGGASAGVAVEGATLREDLDDNATLYGKKLEDSEIVTKWRASTKGCREVARATEPVLRQGTQERVARDGMSQPGGSVTKES
jgi:lipid-binding SYLF domain-containing protein